MLKIVIADDHQLVREGVKSSLGDLSPDLEVFEAENLSEVFELLNQVADVDLILLDLNMPGMNGAESIQDVKQVAPDVAVAILSAFNNRKLVRQALDYGADGYITKASRKEIMLNAIRLILAGEIYLPSLLLEETNEEASDQEEKTTLFSHLEKLTARQQEVFGLMQNGLSNKEIARKVSCTEGTVKAHVTAILKALSVTSRAKAVALNSGNKL